MMNESKVCNERYPKLGHLLRRGSKYLLEMEGGRGGGGGGGREGRRGRKGGRGKGRMGYINTCSNNNSNMLCD